MKAWSNDGTASTDCSDIPDVDGMPEKDDWEPPEPPWWLDYGARRRQWRSPAGRRGRRPWVPREFIQRRVRPKWPKPPLTHRAHLRGGHPIGE